MKFPTSLYLCCSFVLGACSARQPRLLAKPSAAQMGAPTAEGRAALVQASRSPVGIWTGTDGSQLVTLKFGEGGQLLFTSAAGTEAGTWRKQAPGQYAVAVAEFRGGLVLVDPGTASFTLDGSTVELTRK